MEQQDRRDFLGGSDIAPLMGLSRWKSALRLWCEKTGRLAPKDLSDVESVEIGTELEDYVARKFMRKTGFKVRRDTRDFRHPEYDYMCAHIDRWILNEDALLECKTTSAYMEKQWMGEEIPLEYVLQVQWYLGILGKKTGYIAVLIGGQKFRWKSIEFDQDLFAKMVAAAKEFWEIFVKGDLAPVASALDNETLAEMYPTDKTISKDLTADDAVKLDMLIEERLGGKEQEKEVQKEIEKIEAQIKQILAESGQAVTDNFVVTWKNQKRADIDREKMEADGVLEKYQKVNEFRVLRTTKQKGASA
jgi:putative phage-type endonuclease